MNCPNCGAPIEITDEVCKYCGTMTQHGIDMLEERKRAEKEEQKRLAIENLPKIKYVSTGFVIFLYVITFGYYSPYWYATRMQALNNLDTPAKLPAWAVGLYALVCCVTVFTSEIADAIGLAPEMSQEIFNYATAVVFSGSILLAFLVRKILQSYAAKFMERDIAAGSIVPSGIMLVLFGPVYLQICINNMIKMKLLAPKI